MNKKIFFLAMIIVATLASCIENKKDKEEHAHHEETKDVIFLTQQQRQSLDLKLGSFQFRSLSTIIKTNGQLEVPPAASAEITAVIGGNVKEIKVFHGDKVNNGQVLAILEHPDYITLQEDFAETANKLDYIEKEYNRQKELFENNVGSGKDYQQIISEYRTVKSKYEGLKSRLKILNISPEKVLKGTISGTIPVVSPISGYVNDVNIKLGSFADAKDKLFTIADNREIHADFMIYENDIRLLKSGQKVYFTVANQPDRELEATIFAIGKEFESDTRAIHVHARLNNNPGDLIPGMYVSGNIRTNDENVRTLPNDAIVTEGNKSYIFILDKSVKEVQHEGEEQHNENVMAFRRFEIVKGKQDGGFTEVKLLKSLPKNTQIVINSAYYLLSDMSKEETEHEH